LTCWSTRLVRQKRGMPHKFRGVLHKKPLIISFLEKSGQFVPLRPRVDLVNDIHSFISPQVLFLIESVSFPLAIVHFAFSTSGILLMPQGDRIHEYRNEGLSLKSSLK
jgi:hypothetical protein